MCACRRTSSPEPPPRRHLVDNHGLYHGISKPWTEELAITAFLLLKPDCLRLGITAEALRLISEAGLRVEERRRIRLTPADVRYLWSEYTDDGHVLARAFLDRYLTTDDAEAVLVSGDDAFEKVRRIKRRLRSRHALGMFANVVHAAESLSELDRQMGYLFSGTDSPAGVSHRPGGIDFRPHFDVPKLVSGLWPLLQRDLDAPPPYPLDDGGEHAVILGGDRDHTLDSTVSAIWQSLPGVDPAHAILLALYADRTGGFPIALGNRRSVARCHRALVRHGIRHCWTIDALSTDVALPRPARWAPPGGSAAPAPAAAASVPPQSRSGQASSSPAPA
ncbi:nucleoside diphosphate kinase [Actinoplanes lutulentus]|uniref:Nucleoside diphosphate kinase n=1 Tax=Actinoplanes lutulentus TaxID=1287878 RepID=A0A327Z0Z1_9ACTN|nr:nucleoside diphosphate kinase [Actinoplanes lutulentus]RAK28068.1 nucleoside diphosphate kinase [Actinoplanes lutulentus]